MRAIPIPKDYSGERVIMGESDPTRDDVRPCEYAVFASTIFPGRPQFQALIKLDDKDRELIAKGSRIWLVLEGAEVPWSICTADE